MSVAGETASSYERSGRRRGRRGRAGKRLADPWWSSWGRPPFLRIGAAGNL